MRLLEESIIRTCESFGVIAGRISGLTGVWVDFGDPGKARKIAALGVKTSRWVTMHGLALNVQPDLSYFNNIVPCGITDKAVTSMAQELGKPVSLFKVQQTLQDNLFRLFEMEVV
jgi:lipoyl(octanoyl) transferase